MKISRKQLKNIIAEELQQISEEPAVIQRMTTPKGGALKPPSFRDFEKNNIEKMRKSDPKFDDALRTIAAAMNQNILPKDILDKIYNNSDTLTFKSNIIKQANDVSDKVKSSDELYGHISNTGNWSPPENTNRRPGGMSFAAQHGNHPTLQESKKHMKLTRDKLKQIIKEELEEMLHLQENDDDKIERQVQRYNQSDERAREAMRGDILALWKHAKYGNDIDSLNTFNDIFDDLSLEPLITASGMYADYTVGDLKQLAKNLGIELPQ